MIRADNDELAQVVDIALKTAKPYAIRNVFSKTDKLDRRVAINTLTQRVVHALRNYEVMREARDVERGDTTMPLFPDLMDDGRRGS